MDPMQRRQMVAAVVLAAGEARRFGGRKQLARLGERTLLEHVVGIARAVDLAPVIAVVPPWLIMPASLGTVQVIANAEPGLGMSHSLRLGFAALPAVVEAAVILLGDQPTVSPEAVRALVAARGAQPLVATSVAGRLAAPVLVERSHFGVVEELTGDIGLRQVLDANPELVRAVEVWQHAPDVDTPEDLRALQDG
jgi:molybdenum cofactor cytidylyltransferase